MTRLLRTAAVVGLSLLAAQTTTQASHLQDLNTNFAPAHSGAILVSGTQPTARDAHAVVLDSGRFFSGATAPSSLPVTSVASVLAHALGITDNIGETSPEAQQLLQGGAAQVAKKMPKAQVIFNVESVGKNTLDRFHLSSLSSPSTPHVSLSLSTPSITPPAAAISVAASVATGAEIREHGIVAPKWKNAAGKVISAYSRSHAAESFAASQTLADLVATHTNGQGLTISASASEQLAQAFAVNKPLADAHGAAWSNHYCLALTHSGTVFSSVSSNNAPALDFKVGDLEKQMESSSNSVLNNLGSAIKATVADHIVSLSYAPSKVAAATETAKFDLRQKVDAAFFAELQYALDLPSKLKSISGLQSLLNDEHQDLIVFSFSSFTGLLEAYGRESEQYRGALVLLNQLFPLLSSEYAGLFADHQSAAMQTLVLLGSHTTVLEKQDPRQVEAILKADNVNLDFFPNLYVAASEVASLCARLNKDLASAKYIAYCPSVHAHLAEPAHTHMLVESASQHYSTESVSRAAVWPPTPVFPQPTYRYPTNDEIQRYQIVLWFSIMIALVAIGAVYTLAFMPFKKDTMLYSSFNPNWEDRKRR